MSQFRTFLHFALLTLAAAQPPYRYQAPQVPQPQQPIRQSQPVGSFRPPQPSNSGIYSVEQSPPLVQFNVQGQQSHAQHQQQNFAPVQQHVSAPAPVHVPHTSYAAPIQQQSFGGQQVQQHFGGSHGSVQAIGGQQVQQHFGGSHGSVQAIPSIPQSHQQQVVEQQLGGFSQGDQGGFQSFQSPKTAIITKDIYIHSAPDDHEESAISQQLDNAPIRKNYRIVFIKAPSQNLRATAAALKRAQAAHEEKTVIYVLSKKPDLAEVQQQLQQAHGEQKINKPEVYFIKYKTQEEAQRAQQEIQAQYDALGGTSHISDEGIAPVTSVIGNSVGALNLSGPIAGGGGAVSSGGGSSFFGSQQQSFAQQSFQSQTGGGGSALSFGGAPSNKYLPAKA